MGNLSKLNRKMGRIGIRAANIVQRGFVCAGTRTGDFASGCARVWLLVNDKKVFYTILLLSVRVKVPALGSLAYDLCAYRQGGLPNLRPIPTTFT